MADMKLSAYTISSVAISSGGAEGAKASHSDQHSSPTALLPASHPLFMDIRICTFAFSLTSNIKITLHHGLISFFSLGNDFRGCRLSFVLLYKQLHLSNMHLFRPDPVLNMRSGIH
jgi:hypothetical protein